MDRRIPLLVAPVVLTFLTSVGCQSPYRSDQGALFGGLTGAAVGAVVGDAVGNPGAGAAIGAGVGAVSGAAIGSELDKIEAQNRAMIAQQLGRQVRPGAVTLTEVIEMTQAGVNEELIVNHVRSHGSARVPTTDDVIMLHQNGVSVEVIKVMQSPVQPASAQAPVVIHQSPPPVVVHEYSYGPPAWRPYYHYHHRRPRRSGVSWGVTVGH